MRPSSLRSRCPIEEGFQRNWEAKHHDFGLIGRTSPVGFSLASLFR
jgi:hypothetical protein